MATNKPRITITLEPKTYLLLSRLARIQGRPKSSIVTDIVHAATPMFERMAVILEAAKQADEKTLQKFMESLEVAHALIEKQAVHMLDQGDLLLSLGDPAASSGQQKGGNAGTRTAAQRRRGSRTDPRSSNTGVESPKNKAKRPKKGV